MECNRCNKTIRFQKGIPMEDFLHIRKEWGYFSKWDGMIHEIILCEDCYEELCKTFVNPVLEIEKTELI